MIQPTLTSGIVAFFVESLLFGVFTVTYGICTWILLFRDRGGGGSTRNLVLFSASTVIFVLALVVSGPYSPHRRRSMDDQLSRF